MRFTVKTRALKEAIDVVTHASSGMASTPILENILIHVSFTRVVLTANNLELAIEYILEDDVKIQTEGSFTISNKFLSSYINLVREEEIEIEYEDRGVLIFRTELGETQFKGLPAADFPVIPAIRKDISFSIESSVLKAAFEKTLFSCAQGNIRPTLAGVYMRLTSESIHFASTDSFRLSEYVVENDKNIEKEFSIIVPARAASECMKILPDFGQVDFFMSDNQILAVFGNIRLFSRLLNGHFPDYLGFFPQNFATKGVVKSTDLSNVLKQTNLISRENNFNTKLQFDASSGITVSTGNTEVGTGNIRVVASVSGVEDTIGVNSSYLLEVLQVMKAEYVSLDFASNLAPVMIRSADEKKKWGTFRHIIMPLKI